MDDKKNPTIGFVKDCRRANVALTRAKCALWIVGNAEVLKSNALWSRLVTMLEHRDAVRPIEDFRHLFSQWKASQGRTQCSPNPNLQVS